jgi:hypothetical protein
MTDTLFNVFYGKIKKETADGKLIDTVDTQEIKKKLSSGEYNLVIDQARYPLAALPVIFKAYNLNPDYQRNKVWDSQRKSRLIESLIMNIPIPPIFLYEISPSKYEVMDGLQRISTIIDFLNNKFKLKGLEVWQELNGCSYEELIPEVQDAIGSRYLSGSVILSDSKNTKEKQDDLKRLIFERLNTGGITLTKQEIRNAVNTSKMNTMINDFADNNNTFNNLWHSGEDSKNRMGNREMILRFFAYKDLSYNNNTTVGTSQALDYYSAKSVYFDESKVENLKLYIENTLDFVKTLFGEQAFNKNNGTKSEKMLFDTVMLACSICIDKEVGLNGDMDIENNVQLKNNFLESNRDLFNGKYTSFSKVLERQEAFYNFLNSEIINGTSN